jgi:hypothetical protein
LLCKPVESVGVGMLMQHVLRTPSKQTALVVQCVHLKRGFRQHDIVADHGVMLFLR